MPMKTPVSILQELLSRRGITPSYELVQIEGAVHEPTFRYRVSYSDKDGNLLYIFSYYDWSSLFNIILCWVTALLQYWILSFIHNKRIPYYNLWVLMLNHRNINDMSKVSAIFFLFVAKRRFYIKKKIY